jgi:predicted nucleic acid-binding protein
MIIVDSCGWLEWFSDGKLADEYKTYLTDQENILIPAIILFEVYKILKREIGEEKALLAAGYMKSSPAISLNETLALAAADISLQENLAMADAIIVATARANNCKIITSDADLKNQPNVTYIPKNGSDPAGTISNDASVE